MRLKMQTFQSRFQTWIKVWCQAHKSQSLRHIIKFQNYRFRQKLASFSEEEFRARYVARRLARRAPDTML